MKQARDIPRHGRKERPALCLTLALAALLMLAGQLVAMSRGLAAQGGEWAALCGGGTVMILPGDGEGGPIAVPCPDGVIAAAVFDPAPPAPSRPSGLTPADLVLPRSDVVALRHAAPHPPARGPPALT